MKITYDVLAVNLKTNTVRFMAQGKTKANAEAIENMAVMRRGVDEEFFTTVISGSYSEGEKWEGERIKAVNEEHSPALDGYRIIGGVMFPSGPRGLDS